MRIRLTCVLAIGTLMGSCPAISVLDRPWPLSTRTSRSRLLVAAGADPAARDAEHDTTPARWARVALEVTGNPRCTEVADYLDARRGSGLAQTWCQARARRFRGSAVASVPLVPRGSLGLPFRL